MFDKIMQILEKNNVFLSGGAGVGKSYLTNEIKKAYKRRGKNVIALGSTAISAFNISGTTCHSFFSLGICANLYELKNFDSSRKNKLKKLQKIVKKLDLIIIDEISMISANVLEMIHYRLKSFEFEGKLLVVGDFFQLPPVLKEEKKDLFQKGFYAFSSFVWQDFNFVNLSLNTAKRTQNAEFYAHLSALRKGLVSKVLLEYFQKLCINAKELETMSDDFTLLCGINKKAHLINQKKLAQLPSEAIIFKAHVEKLDKNLSNESLEKWLKGLNINEELRLKIGAKIIFCVNNYEAGYYNGEQGIIESFYKDDEGMMIDIIKNGGEKISLEPYTFTLEDLENEESKVKARLSQFPIKLAYAITIHKSQGMSIKNLICDIDHIFENGQLYVALSRAIEPASLRIFYSKREDFKEYFAKALKLDEEVLEFYENNEFLKVEDL